MNIQNKTNRFTFMFLCLLFIVLVLQIKSDV